VQQKPAARPAEAGFTLLELLVVLVIVAGLVALTTPVFSGVFARVRLAFERDDVERQLLVLPAQVRRDGRSAVLMQGDATAAATFMPAGPNAETWPTLNLDLPAGWSMQVPKPIIYHFNGTCDGGEITFSVPPLSVTYSLTAPLCRPIVNNAAAG
jgi:prepilin-type N-terminal cleavage/methylation domain-containing protein